MSGWPDAGKGFGAGLLGEEAQQLTPPHSRHRRRCTQRSPTFMHSPHPLGVCGSTSAIWSRWVQSAMRFLLSLVSRVVLCVLRGSHAAVDREDRAGDTG